MNDLFEIAAGSVTGRSHRLQDCPNQDAYHILQTERSLIAVVADGCSSGRYSQVGSRLGVHLAVQSLNHVLQTHVSPQSPDFWQQVYQDWLTQLQNLFTLMGGELNSWIHDYGLYTLVGVCITSEQTSVFAIGDGVVALNGKISVLGPFPHNAPPYLAYGVENPDPSALQVIYQCPTQDLRTLLIGTDGVQDLIKVEGKTIPGRSEAVPELEDFWQCDRYFRNPDQLRRQLALINRDALLPDWEKQHLIPAPGLLPDDTTMVVIRRKQY